MVGEVKAFASRHPPLCYWHAVLACSAIDIIISLEGRVPEREILASNLLRALNNMINEEAWTIRD